ncbi:hypothetical protein QUB30_02715 [Microcoleus sp. BROC3]
MLIVECVNAVGRLSRSRRTTVYSTKYLQGCQDVEENNLTEVGDDRKIRTLFAQTSQLFANCLAMHVYLLEWR